MSNELPSDKNPSWLLPDAISYEDWVSYIFDHPILEPEWWWQERDSGYFQHWNEKADPSCTLGYLTHLFLNSSHLKERFTRARIDKGLSFILESQLSRHLHVWDDQSLPWCDRKVCMDFVVNLFRDLMGPLHGDNLGHLWKTGDEPMYACYMWWDSAPILWTFQHPELELLRSTILNVFQQILQIKSEACQESALHGLGHWHYYVPERTEPIVRQFLEEHPELSPELREYAELAAIGNVQ